MYIHFHCFSDYDNLDNDWAEPYKEEKMLIFLCGISQVNDDSVDDLSVIPLVQGY